MRFLHKMPQTPNHKPAQPYRSVAAYVRSMLRDPDMKATGYSEEMEIIAKKLDEADDVFFSLGEMMTIWRSSGLLDKHPEFVGAFERAQTAYRTARGEI